MKLYNIAAFQQPHDFEAYLLEWYTKVLYPVHRPESDSFHFLSLQKKSEKAKILETMGVEPATSSLTEIVARHFELN